MNTDLPDDLSAGRILDVAGSHNLRDMGGYETADGRRVKWRTLYRSGALANLPEASDVFMRGLGIATICDLRTPEERHRKPMTWHATGHETGNVHFYGAALNISVGDLERTIAEGRLRGAELRQGMEAVYRLLPFDQRAGYRELFRLLAAGALPLLFSCAAGKDRTGVAAALVLYGIGVPRATIEHDYQLTNLFVGRRERMLLEDARYAPLTAMTREDYLPLLRAEASYLEFAFNQIERECGSIEGYLETVLGAGPAELELMRGFMLE